ncbi:MAG: pitrilysin family protein [Acidobacteriota bacterium]
MKIKKTILKSGITVLTEKFTQIPSFALSYTLKSGSRNEIINTSGIHHLMEHMLFKGTKKYSVKDIAYISDRLGGRLNAFTSKEITQFYIKAIDEKLDQAFDLLTNIIFSSNFEKSEFKKEVEVILQEIREGDDNPDSKAFELFYEKLFPENGVGLPIAGTIQSVSALSRDLVHDTYTKLYSPENLILSYVGNVEHSRIVEFTEKHLSNINFNKNSIHDVVKPSFNKNIFVQRNKNLKQIYSIIGLPGISVVNPDRYKFMIMNDILGAGMSSRLFQNIREQRGLAYTISSFVDSFQDFGLHIIYSILEPGKIDEYLKTVKNEIEVLKTEGVTSEELDKSKDHIKSSLILSLENNISKMRLNVNQELYFKKQKKINEIIDEVNRVTINDIKETANKFMDLNNVSVLLYGDLPETKDYSFNV